MKTFLLTMLCLLGLSVTVFPNDGCGEHDVGALATWIDGDTLVVISQTSPATQWWTQDLNGECRLVGLIVSPEALMHYYLTGEYQEPSLATSTPPTFETSWTSGGVEHKVVTPKRSGESSTSWAKSHRTHVEALKSLYPPDPPRG